MVVGSGGVVKKVANHGIRPLGYKMRKNNETHSDAHYVALHMDMNPQILAEVQHNLKLNDHVLRWMAINTERGVYQKFRDNSGKSKAEMLQR